MVDAYFRNNETGVPVPDFAVTNGYAVHSPSPP